MNWTVDPSELCIASVLALLVRCWPGRCPLACPGLSPSPYPGSLTCSITSLLRACHGLKHTPAKLGPVSSRKVKRSLLLPRCLASEKCIASPNGTASLLLVWTLMVSNIDTLCGDVVDLACVNPTNSATAAVLNRGTWAVADNWRDVDCSRNSDNGAIAILNVKLHPSSRGD